MESVKTKTRFVQFLRCVLYTNRIANNLKNNTTVSYQKETWYCFITVVIQVFRFHYPRKDKLTVTVLMLAIRTLKSAYEFAEEIFHFKPPTAIQTHSKITKFIYFQHSENTRLYIQNRLKFGCNVYRTFVVSRTKHPYTYTYQVISEGADVHFDSVSGQHAASRLNFRKSGFECLFGTINKLRKAEVFYQNTDVYHWSRCVVAMQHNSVYRQWTHRKKNTKIILHCVSCTVFIFTRCLLVFIDDTLKFKTATLYF